MFQTISLYLAVVIVFLESCRNDFRCFDPNSNQSSKETQSDFFLSYFEYVAFELYIWKILAILIKKDVCFLDVERIGIEPHVRTADSCSPILHLHGFSIIIESKFIENCGWMVIKVTTSASILIVRVVDPSQLKILVWRIVACIVQSPREAHSQECQKDNRFYHKNIIQFHKFPICNRFVNKVYFLSEASKQFVGSFPSMYKHLTYF